MKDFEPKREGLIDLVGIYEGVMARKSYADLSDRDMGKIQELFEYDHNPQASAFMQEQKEPIRGLENQERINRLKTSLGAVSGLPLEQQSCAKRRLFFMIGNSYERIAAHDQEAEGLPLYSAERNQNFARAIHYYNEAEVVTGFNTDYSLRIAECFNGMGQTSAFANILKRMLGNDTLIMSHTNKSDRVMLEELKRLSEESSVKVPGGGSVHFLDKNNLPDLKSN